MEHSVELLHTGFVTHDVTRFVTTRPDGLDYEPGQGVEVAIDRDGWRDQGRPFTPTNLPDEPVLEFTIKSYPEHDGVTERLHRLDAGATLRMSDPFGTITWAGPGTFIAGGAGITPFLAILRQRAREGDVDRCSLHFSNKTPADVICEKELRFLLGDRCHLTCTQTGGPGFDDRRLDRAYLETIGDALDTPVYLCGPPGFVESLHAALLDLSVDEDDIVLEE